MITEKSFAKINLFLHIINRRDDGYHNISTLMKKINLFDTISIEDSDSFEIISNEKSIPLNENNIIWKVYSTLSSLYKISPIKVYLYKKIPWGAGLGGGSSNAATFLNLVDRMFHLNLTYEQKFHILEKVGSDTVFFIKDSDTVLAEGRGEILTDGPTIPKLNLLLVKPSFPVSTKDAYEGVNLRLTKKFYIDKMPSFLGYSQLLSIMENDFESTVFKKYRELGEIKNMLMAKGADISLMSGSGSTVYGLFSSKRAIENAYFHFKQNRNYFVLQTTTL
ncbi:MAG: 4-(cytidine 5'-diphospho)-2-C-methyl-D-erythritol kinase [Calditerrivibrio sp.]|nr:4-(cytidine 5'-diphospho)-2-C-methyl-D-erythritol kinase [Calditerrivibrio sp.]MCA1931994.1 4-(cytidine 5'-diphospho)-2-C-methyl-D-erythritol kinase [Calditerrivibrio sp.]MCA1980168.1 4-(cytidine 5'-diphospho)-2-C-methyl-D-erythritol kinase [Calditerrivibrio sp.]